MRSYSYYKDKVVNLFLKLRYRLLKNVLKRKNWYHPDFVADFNKKDFTISDGYQYGANMVTLKENVEVKDNKLYLHAKPYNKIHKGWQGSSFREWSIGWIDYKGKVNNPYGTWVSTITIPEDAFPAFWFLRVEHEVPNIPNRHHIIPEVDVMEVIGNKLKHTVHYGYLEEGYRRESYGTSVVKYEPKEYEFAVTMSKKNYKFYIDGVLTGIITEPEALSSIPCYPVLNNAIHEGRIQEKLTMIVKELKYYPNV